MIGHVLRFEKAESGFHELVHEPDQCDLRCVGSAGEHAFAEERASDSNAVKPADKRVAVADFNGMRHACVVEFAVEANDRIVDPSLLAASALSDHLTEAGIDGDTAVRFPQIPRETPRHMEISEFNQASRRRVEPKQVA